MRALRGIRFATVLVAATLGMAACGSSGGTSSSTGSSSAPAAAESPSAAAAAKSDVKVGLAYDIGGRGDKSFNDAAYTGLSKAASELGVTTKDISPNTDGSDREARLKLLADAGYNPIVAVGFAYADALKKVAEQYPKVNFAIVDDSSFTAPNVTSLVFAENEGSFLVGAAAALKTQTKSVGYIGGVQTPLLEKFQAGFDAGVKAVDPSIKIQDKYLTQPPDFSGFGAPDKGKVTAQGMYDSGADIVFAAAGGSGAGVFEAAKAAGKKAIGVDSDQYLSADPAVKDVIMTSMVKRVDVAVFNYIKSAVDGSIQPGTVTYDLKADGVGFATSGGFVDDIKPKLDDYKQKIISGEIKVPTTP